MQLQECSCLNLRKYLESLAVVIILVSIIN
jgi:hypothetical protein